MKISESWAVANDAEETCIACGTSIPRSNAREYHKDGNRWNRADKEFEYLCKECDKEACHQPRNGLERTLVEAGAGTVEDAPFLRKFCALVQNQDQTRDREER